MFHVRTVLPGLALLMAMAASAQYREKMDLQLRAYLQQPHPPGEQVDLFIHGERVAVAVAVLEHGGSVKNSRPDLVSARVPVERVANLSADPAVGFFEFSLDPGQVLNDSMRVKAHVNEVHAGLAPLPEGYDGTGVIMGIIDSGLDHQHPDFQDAQGNTRILKYWDQTLPNNGQTPQPWNYGQVWTRAQIDVGQMTSVDQPSYNGHGSTVTGTAAGNGLANGRHKGVAPGAELIIVSAAFNGNFRAHVADAVQYIFLEAQAQGKPAVINASLGSYLGSHDGLDAAALLIDDLLIERGGRVMVCAAGNSGNPAQFRYHLRNDVAFDTTFTWFQFNPSSALGFGSVFFEVWADVNDFQGLNYAVGADRVSPSYQYRGRTPYHNVNQNLGITITEPLVSTSGNLLGTVQTYAVQRGGQYVMQVLIQQPDSNAYHFRFMATGFGKYDIWSSAQFGTSNMVSTIPTVAEYPPMSKYILPDNDKHIVDSWACSSRVLTVANYSNETSYIDCNGAVATVPGLEDDLSVNSSKGPTRDLRQKPDLAATGDITLSAAPLSVLAAIGAVEPFKIAEGCMHLRNGGTSMASPVVAGAAALYLQKCPKAPHTEVMAALNSTARTDVFTGTIPNNRWGHGKLDAFAAVSSSNINGFTIQMDGPPAFCAGASVLAGSPSGFSDHQWSTGGSSASVAISEPGPVSLIAANSSGCRAYSDTLTFVELPVPPAPTISQDVPLALVSSVSPGYQWYLNDAPIQGETGQMHIVGTSGTYQVAAIDANGCGTISAPVEVLIVGLEELAPNTFALWPSPAQDVLHLQLVASPQGTATVRVLDASGHVVLQQAARATDRIDLGIQGLAAGTYVVQVDSGADQWTRRFVKLP